MSEKCMGCVAFSELLKDIRGELERAAAERDEFKAEAERLRDMLENIAEWRERCWDHDDDMGHERRSFTNDDAWDLVEEAARAAISEAPR